MNAIALFTGISILAGCLYASSNVDACGTNLSLNKPYTAKELEKILKNFEKKDSRNSLLYKKNGAVECYLRLNPETGKFFKVYVKSKNKNKDGSLKSFISLKLPKDSLFLKGDFFGNSKKIETFSLSELKGLAEKAKNSPIMIIKFSAIYDGNTKLSFNMICDDKTCDINKVYTIPQPPEFELINKTFLDQNKNRLKKVEEKKFNEQNIYGE